MARKTKTIHIDTGRDKGKTFLITEKPIIQADKWAQRALFALAGSGIDTAGINPNGGMLEMAKLAISVISRIDPQIGGELLDELLTCVKIVPSGGLARSLDIESDIEDLKTLFELRKEALLVHIDFLTNGNLPDMN